MLSIGQFSHLTGLGVKALRFYHDRRLLVPDEVDTFSGTRRYGVGQVGTAQWVRLLRQAGLGLEQVRDAIDDPDRLESLLRDHHEAVSRRRREEDRAAAEIDRFLAGSSRVATRTVAAMDLAVRAVPLPDDESASPVGLHRLIDLAVDSLLASLADTGWAPDGPHSVLWTDARDGAALSNETALCVAVPVTRASPDLGKPLNRAGQSLNGAELVHWPSARERVVVLPDGAGEAMFASAIAALFEPDDDIRIDAATLRQTQVNDGVAVSVRITAPEG